MTQQASAGPLIIFGQQPPVVPGATPPDYNGDAAASLGYGGWGLLDLRYGFKNGGQSLPQAAGYGPLGIGFSPGVNYIAVDQAPSAVSTSNVAAAQNAVSQVNLTLAAASTGISFAASALVVIATGLVIPGGTLLVDGIPGNCFSGGTPYITEPAQNNTLGFYNPGGMLVRALSITGVGGSAGGSFLVKGYNLWGQPQTETIVAAAGAVTTNGAKGWKFVTSIMPQFTDANNYSVGTADIFEFPIRVDRVAYATIYWNNTLVITPTGFVAANTTVPQTASTGSTRGTYAIQADTSDGVKALQVLIGIPPANLYTAAGNFGVTPA